MEKHITQNGIKYELRGEQYYPMLKIAEQKEHKIGKYGLLHRDYIKQHKRGIYITLLTEGKINALLLLCLNRIICWTSVRWQNVIGITAVIRPII